jgi:hypothetical protein
VRLDEEGEEEERWGHLIGLVDAMMWVQPSRVASEKLLSSIKPNSLELEEEVGRAQVMMLWIRSVRKHRSSPSKPLKAMRQSGCWSGGSVGAVAAFFVSFFGVFFRPFVKVFSSPSLSLATGPAGDLVGFAVGLVWGGGDTTALAPLWPTFGPWVDSGGDFVFVDFPEVLLELLRLGESGSGRELAASGVGSETLAGLVLVPSVGAITLSAVIKKSFSAALEEDSRHCSTHKGDTTAISINSAARRCFKFPFAQIMWVSPARIPPVSTWAPSA